LFSQSKKIKIMKKVVALLSFVMFSTLAFAQPQGGMDPEARKARMKEQIKPQLVQQAKITDAQADKVIDIYFDAQMEAGKLRRDESISQDDKQKKVKEINEARDKKIKEIPLTDVQAKEVATFFEEQRKRMQERRPQGGGGN
jgi:phage I-like protein